MGDSYDSGGLLKPHTEGKKILVVALWTLLIVISGPVVNKSVQSVCDHKKLKVILWTLRNDKWIFRKTLAMFVSGSDQPPSHEWTPIITGL